MAPPASPTPASDRAFTLILTYSAALGRLNLTRALHEYRYLLPDHIRRSKMLVAWKVPRKLAGILCTFKYTKPKDRMPNLPHSSSPPPAARGRGTLSL